MRISLWISCDHMAVKPLTNDMAKKHIEMRPVIAWMPRKCPRRVTYSTQQPANDSTEPTNCSIQCRWVFVWRVCTRDHELDEYSDRIPSAISSWYYADQECKNIYEKYQKGHTYPDRTQPNVPRCICGSNVPAQVRHINGNRKDHDMVEHVQIGLAFFPKGCVFDDGSHIFPGLYGRDNGTDCAPLLLWVDDLFLWSNRTVLVPYKFIFVERLIRVGFRKCAAIIAHSQDRLRLYKRVNRRE